MIPIKLEFREGTLFRQLQDEIDVLKEQLRLSYAENKYILDQRDELQHKLDEEQKAHFEEHTRFVKLEYIAMDLQKRLDIVVVTIKALVHEINIDENVSSTMIAVLDMAEDALKKLEE